jgi:Polyketide cyclase / dehydrase and lipid transport
MAVNRRFAPHTPSEVFAVLRDGATYDRWVVGTTKIRAVDDIWPVAGSKLHYRAGYGPLAKDDETRSVRYEPDSLLELEAVARPFGTVSIQFRVEPTHDGSLITLTEHPSAGWARALHNQGVDAAIWLRNVETLRRLARQIQLRSTASRPDQ